jgi:thiamin-phosphate kinase
MSPSSLVQKRMSVGKIPNDVLKSIVFKFTGVKNPHVISGPAVGEDAAVVDYHGKLLVIKSDPITGAEKNAGWLVVHVNANDIAVRGATPLFYLSTIIMPENLTVNVLEDISKGIGSAAKELGVTVVGGHTEVTSAVSRPVLCGTMIGEPSPKGIILSSGAKVGDSIVVTKSVALEGTAILASDRYDELRVALDDGLLRRAQGFLGKVSVVREALAAAETGYVNCMKDPTEGGLLQALNEIAEASKVGYSIDEKLVPIKQETNKICETLHVDPLKLISSGMLIATVPQKAEEQVIARIKEVGVDVAKIGEIINKGRNVKKLSGKTEAVEEFIEEELWRALKTKPRQ